MTQPIIEVQNLSKRYRLGVVGATTLRDDAARLWQQLRGKTPPAADDDFWALRDVSFSIHPGEVVGILGRNGAGKSTLLKILSRVTEPTSGRAILRGRVASLLEVGTGFHPDLTGRENVYLNGAILGMKKREITARFDEIVAFAEVEKFIDTPVKHYSSGMRVRLAFAVAAHLDSEILIVDEVLAVGDASFQNKCMGKMRDVSRTGRTVLFVSHNMQAISTLTERCLVLDDGTIRTDAPTDQAIECYLGSQGAAIEYIAEPASSSPCVTYVSIETSDPGQVQKHGLPLKIKIRAQCSAPVPEAQISVQICNSFDIPVIHLAMFDQAHPLFRATGEYGITCVIPALHLYMGDYQLRVHLGSTRGHLHIQTIDRICPFQVVMHGIERPWPWRPDECLYVEKCEWQSRRLEPGAAV
jgi:lipopolysaccharide transport system ATP-binding protein